jgi:hypothetical protein
VKCCEVDYAYFTVFGKNLDSPYVKDFCARNHEIETFLGFNAASMIIHELSASVHDLVLKRDLNRKKEEIID